MNVQFLLYRTVDDGMLRYARDLIAFIRMDMFLLPAVGAFYSVVPFVAEYPDSPHISFLKIHFIFPNDESGQTRKIIFPTISLCSTQPTSELRESTLLSRWSPSTKYVPAGTT